ncbi:carbohydrate ABC transporter permease [Microbacterium sp. NIBRBAC000506063]|uniref:carbohydrate ABC transporter permease n=1 Tax=Microbacterium sp. NIBRBAC000506063 TaxID=2734618 RepID=UPI002948BFBB|nr:carbohydrate ABC transporter permease [Microbacterium sp. NIBRBAC000506063]
MGHDRPLRRPRPDRAGLPRTDRLDGAGQLQAQRPDLRLQPGVHLRAHAGQLRHGLRPAPRQLSGLHLELVLRRVHGHGALARARRPRRLRDEPLPHEQVGDGRAPGTHHPGREPARAVVLHLRAAAHDRRLHAADPLAHVRVAAADPVHHDVVLRPAPEELEESAQVDGLTAIGAFFRITLPLSVPGIATATILSFIFSWNNFMFALVLAGQSTKTLPVAIFDFIGYASIDWGALMAASVVVTTPIMLIALFTQRYIVSGLTAGATKG